MERDGRDELEERAQLIAARAERLLVDEFAQWEGYCLPGCPNCAIEFAREQLDEELGWGTTEEMRFAPSERASAVISGGDCAHAALPVV